MNENETSLADVTVKRAEMKCNHERGFILVEDEQSNFEKCEVISVFSITQGRPAPKMRIIVSSGLLLSRCVISR